MSTYGNSREGGGLMRHRIAAVLGAALVLLAWLPGSAVAHHKEQHGDTAQVAGTTEPPFVWQHSFVPDYITVRAGGTVEFTNDDFNVEGFGPPHTWTVLDPTCDPSAVDGCRFDTGVLEPGGTAEVNLRGLPSGQYTFICRVGQGGELPFSLVLEPHATQDDAGWTGMVGTLMVVRP